MSFDLFSACIIQNFKTDKDEDGTLTLLAALDKDGNGMIDQEEAIQILMEI